MIEKEEGGGEMQRRSDTFRPPFYVVYGRMSCPYTARAIEALEYAGIPYKFVQLDQGEGTRPSSFLTPGDWTAWLAQERRVPLVVEYCRVVVVGGSDALLAKLADAQREPRAQRAQQRQIKSCIPA